jgi:hypothetical protein
MSILESSASATGMVENRAAEMIAARNVVIVGSPGG